MYNDMNTIGLIDPLFQMLMCYYTEQFWIYNCWFQSLLAYNWVGPA